MTIPENDYHALLIRIKNGEKVACTLRINDKVMNANAVCLKTSLGDIYEIAGIGASDDMAMFTREADFIAFCIKTGLEFEERDFLKDTKKMLEIAKNAADFRAFTVPLNTPQEVELLLDVIYASELR